jgi:uncharacterized protein (DUF433 family)
MSADGIGNLQKVALQKPTTFPYNRTEASGAQYIEQRDGGYYVAGTRISLDSVVYSFKDGQSPEAIQEDFPLLKRSQVYGEIAFYLDDKPEIDKYLEDTRREFEGCGVPLSATNPVLWEKIQRSRTHAGESRS